MGPKKNQQKMSLGTFLQDENFGSWADEMEDMPLPSSDSRPNYATERRTFGSTTGMGMGGGFSERRDMFPSREALPLPTEPPYTAHLANLSFDATQGDISDFFRDCQVTNVRIVEDQMDRKPKGFGYVEFGTLDGLKTALDLSGSNLSGRSVRISVAEPPKNRQDTRDFSDWSRKGPLPDLPNNQRRVSDRQGGFGGGDRQGGFGGGSGRSFDNTSDAGSERGQRRGFGEGDGKVRDFSNWERRGPLSPASPAPTSLREGGRQASKEAGFRRNSPAWGEGRSQDGSRPPRREFTERPPPERQAGASEMDNQWRARMRPDAPAKAPTPEASEPSSPAPAPAPATRPRLNLAKRTVSEADPQGSPAPASDSKASPFGAARPVDTAAKEKEVEEKRQLAIRQKREADEKAKAEKAEERRLAKEKGDAEKSKEPASKESKEPKENKENKDTRESKDIRNTTETSETTDTAASKENGEETSQQTTPKYDILRRADSGMNDMVADDHEEEVEENLPVDDKAVKPKEIVQDPPSRANGSWRNAPPAQAPEGSTTAALEEEGWSTVSKPSKQRNNRRNYPSRAIAS
ncbi:Eukaryotic translation initiation factor 4B [Exophiala xenobiotica]|nr:Eukaryotic translation initiation factor 4B [Exophiala xenobiotica]KAK5392894.1 Eukaryotic translation initiation factor 4B [Exophiala xenobiotica]KAK5411949.1 Eukaryotic translation initiation factor 4B [Exophiala xenobiotica]KAK5460520.1 Eukaryotic translation initiation factor 4B [Exophiala xenobiotica]KAK5481204.1 Eukaryotic translation initiation factor 4B [Exophiala xenobiotica]